MAALLAFWNLNFGLPFLYRPDEDTVIGRSLRMVVQHSLDTVYPNWLPLGFYLYAAAEGISSLLGTHNLQAATSGDPTAAYLTGRVLSACMQVLTTIFVSAAARRVYGPIAGLLAGAMVAVAPLSVRQAHFATVDGILTMFVAATLLAAVSARGARGYLLAGALAGLAAGIKYNGAVAFVLPLAMALQSTSPWRAAVYALAGAAAGFGVPGLGMLFDLPSYLQTAAFLGRDLYQHRSPEPVGWLFDPAVVLPFGLGFGTYALALAGTALAAWHRRPAEIALLCFAGAYLLVLGSGHENFFRYVMPVFPALCVLGSGWISAVRPGAVPYALAACSLLLVPSLYASVSTDRLLGEQDTRTSAAQWLDAHLPPGSTLAAPYYASPFYDSAMVKNQSRYIQGDELAASFLQGRFTSRFRMQIGAVSGDAVMRASGPPQQSPLPPAGAADFTISPYANPRLLNGSAVYDPLDSFYLPIWGFEGLERMGPALAITRHR